MINDDDDDDRRRDNALSPVVDASYRMQHGEYRCIGLQRTDNVCVCKRERDYFLTRDIIQLREIGNSKSSF